MLGGQMPQRRAMAAGAVRVLSLASWCAVVAHGGSDTCDAGGLMGWLPSAEGATSGHFPGKKVAQVPEVHWPVAADQTKYLWAYCTASQGFGDSIRWFYDLIGLALETKRTLIPPPISFSEVDMSELAGMDPYKMQAEDPDGWAGKVQAAGLNLITSKKRFVPFTQWFDRKLLEKLLPVLEWREWHGTSKGRVPFVVVPGKGTHAAGCDPKWAKLCKGEPQHEWDTSPENWIKDPSSKEPRQLRRNDDEIFYERIHCMGDEDRGLEFKEMQHMPNVAEGAKVMQFYDKEQVLGLDGFCSSASILTFDDTRHSANPIFQQIRAHMRFAPAITQAAQAFQDRQAALSGKFIAIHWRHGDIFNMDPASELKNHGSKSLIKRVKRAMDQEYPGALTSVSGVFLLTNTYQKSELQEIEMQAREVLGVPLVRFTSDDWILDTAVDMVLASKAEYLFFTHCGSFFTTFIEQERDMLPDGTYSFKSHDVPPMCLNRVLQE